MNIHAAKKLRARSSLVAITLLFTAMAHRAQAQSIAADPSEDVLNVSSSTDLTLTFGNQGYDFFAAGPGNTSDLYSPATYATVTNLGGDHDGQSSIDVGGTVSRSGIAVLYTEDLSTPVAQVNIVEAGSFTLYVLNDNFYPDPVTLQLYSSLGLPIGTTVVIEPVTTGSNYENDLMAVTVSNVTAGETITLSGNSGNDTDEVGGVGFTDFVAPGGDTTVPEPSTYALMGLGALALVLKLRARRA